jgi:hypothetical protein
MPTPTVARLLTVSLLLAVAGCDSKPAAAPDAGNAANSASPNSSSSPNSSASNSPSAAPAPALPAPAPVVIPAGTTLTITLDQTLNSKTANNGDSFAASLSAPVAVGTAVALPVGTKATGTIVAAQSAGRFNGNALLQLTLDSVRLNGSPYPIQTSEFEDVGRGRGKRTAVGAGGGAAFGAIVGALAGGGKGAAIGALAGGGAGTAGAAFTGKKDIVLPAETRLHFRLVQPLTVTVASPN